MSELGHNGGPDLDADSIKLRYVKVNIGDILEGLDGLSWEQRGYYVTLLFKMYARQGGIPADDRGGSVHMRCDVRTFRRMRDALLAAGKVYVDDGVLRNARVEREIAEFCREGKRRREAALEREKRRRVAGATDDVQPEVPADFARTLPGLCPDFARTLPGLSSDFDPTKEEKVNENNGCTATTGPRTSRATTNHKPLTRKEEEEGKAFFPALPHARGNGNSYWSQALAVPGAFDQYEGVAWDADSQSPTLHNGVRADWLAKFGGDELLLDAELKAIAPYVQPNSGKPLKVQVEAQLARAWAEDRKRTKRYEGRAGKTAPKETYLERLARQCEDAEARLQPRKDR